MFMTDAFTSAVQMVFGSALTLATFILILVVARFTSWDQFFFTFFKFPNFSVQIYGLGQWFLTFFVSFTL